MEFEIGDTVIFKSRPGSHYVWQLKDFNKYTILSRAFNSYPRDGYKGETIYYSVKSENGTETSWYEGEDFITINEYRKEKLKKLNYGSM